MSWLNNTRGQAAVEAALLLPVLLLVLLGIFVVGQWFNAQLVVTAAAREGARAGALLGEWQCVKNAVNKAVQTIDKQQAPTLEVYKVTSEGSLEQLITDPLPNPGENLMVKVSYSFTPISEYFKNEYEKITNQPFPFSNVYAQVTARMEFLPTPDEPKQCLEL